VAQSASTTQSTQRLETGSQTWFIAEQSRDERHVGPRGTQIASRHVVSVGQSLSAMQSTQYPRIVSHT
jgi:hypothetical protein